MTDLAGRSCPLRYHYGAEAIAGAPTITAETLYVVGGLYGNLQALAAVEAMAAAEAGPVSLIFNGDFNWFNVDEPTFTAINQRVLAHHAILGNVEAELGVAGDAAGCGCAYPAHVDTGIVDRSNQIHARLKATASKHPQILEQLAALPMFARFNIGACRIGIVHGDADTLAGWRFDVSALDAPDNQPWLAEAFRRAEVDLFASTHTCLPALRQIALKDATGLLINNGAAGMPNFTEQGFGLLTRLSLTPPPGTALYGTQHQGIHVHALPIRYDRARWEHQFLANWPPGSAAWLSYHQRIAHGPTYDPQRATGAPATP